MVKEAVEPMLRSYTGLHNPTKTIGSLISFSFPTLWVQIATNELSSIHRIVIFTINATQMINSIDLMKTFYFLFILLVQHINLNHFQLNLINRVFLGMLFVVVEMVLQIFFFTKLNKLRDSICESFRRPWLTYRQNKKDFFIKKKSLSLTLPRPIMSEIVQKLFSWCQRCF